MRTITYILIVFLFLGCASKNRDYGKFIINKYQPIYEDDDSYFPHDYFVENIHGMMAGPGLFVKKENNHLKIINKSHDGFTGHKVEFTLSNENEIINVEYDSWILYLTNQRRIFCRGYFERRWG